MENAAPNAGPSPTEATEDPPLEKFLNEAGWGLYSKFIVGIICFVNFAQGVTFAAVPWALALSTCDLLFIPKNIALKIFTSLFIGKLLGQIFLSIVVDRYGRKRYLTYSLIFVFMSTFIAAFAYNAVILVGAILFLGIGLETNNTIVSLLLAEILPQERRGFYLSLCCLFWTIGYFITTGFTILFETRTFLDYEHPDPRLAPWRVMFVSCGGINIFIACACALLEESPRHYLYLGKTYLGYLILKQLYAINTSMHADSFKKLLSNWPCCIWYSLISTYQTRILSKMETANPGVIGCTLILCLVFILSDKFSTCGDSDKNKLFHQQFLMFAGSIVLGSFLCMIFVEKIGRRWLVSSLTSSALAFVTEGYYNYTILAFILIVANSLLWTVISILTIESYPTAIRSTVMAATSIVGLLAQIIYINFMNMELKIFSLCLGVTYFCLSFFSFLIEELKNKPMVE